MLLTTSQYKQLADLQKKELTKEKFQQKLSSLGLYFSQTDKVLTLVKTLSTADFISMQELNKKLASFNVTIESFNAPMTNSLRSGEKSLISLSFAHTEDFPKMAGIPFKAETAAKQALLTSLQNPIPDSKFKLSASIWGTDKRTAILQYIKQNIQQGMSKDELLRNLDTYLQDQNIGGAYQKAERVIDTEFQRAYSVGTVTSSRNFNAQREQQLIWYRKTGPGHKLTDICDDVAGYYSLENDVPIVPSHPWCICIMGRIFASDYTGNLTELSASDLSDLASRYGQSVQVF